MKQNMVTPRTEIVNRQQSSLKIVRKGLRGISEKQRQNVKPGKQKITDYVTK